MTADNLLDPSYDTTEIAAQHLTLYHRYFVYAEYKTYDPLGECWEHHTISTIFELPEDFTMHQVISLIGESKKPTIKCISKL